MVSEFLELKEREGNTISGVKEGWDRDQGVVSK